MNGKTKIASEIKRNLIKQLANSRKRLQQKGCLDFDSSSMVKLKKAMEKMKDVQFWIDNRTATIEDLIKVFKIPSSKAQRVKLGSGGFGSGLSMESKSIIDRIDTILGD